MTSTFRDSFDTNKPTLPSLEDDISPAGKTSAEDTDGTSKQVDEKSSSNHEHSPADVTYPSFRKGALIVLGLYLGLFLISLVSILTVSPS
jgi:hypothetical protein